MTMMAGASSFQKQLVGLFLFSLPPSHPPALWAGGNLGMIGRSPACCDALRMFRLRLRCEDWKGSWKEKVWKRENDDWREWKGKSDKNWKDRKLSALQTRVEPPGLGRRRRVGLQPESPDRPKSTGWTGTCLRGYEEEEEEVEIEVEEEMPKSKRKKRKKKHQEDAGCGAAGLRCCRQIERLGLNAA